MDIEKKAETAHALANAARAAVLPFFRSAGLVADNKHSDGAFDPVTEADRAAERAMRAILAEVCPEDGVLGEEFGEVTGQSGLTWVLDPIDGTRAFLSGSATWGVLVALSDDSGPVYGLIDQSCSPPFPRSVTPPKAPDLQRWRNRSNWCVMVWIAMPMRLWRRGRLILWSRPGLRPMTFTPRLP
jgi:3'-phosphoadenosine 5'-phosphosulfate (PAPS) 3'-phosphatase